MIKHSEILKSDWDILIVLDACRYDIFKEVVGSEFFGSVIQEADSEAGCTRGWLDKHFKGSTDFRDVVYISGNPYINSYGIGLKTKEIFYDVFDSWEYRYDNTDRVEPVGVFLDAKKTLMYARNRVIVHFLQPHYPYLFDSKKFNPLDLIYKLVPNKIIKKINKVFKRNKINKDNTKNTISRIEETYQLVYTDEQIRDAYTNNLISIIPYLKKLISEEKNKKIVVTADHSEYLGENGRYGHGGKINGFINKVPYVVIEV